MGTTWPVSSRDVERYKQLRSRARELNHRILETLPGEAMREMGQALGMLHQGILVFETEDVISVLMDCCLFDWLRDGVNAIEKYWHDHASELDSEECCVLEAYRQAQYRILMLEAVHRDAGMDCVDLLSRERLLLMDVALSQTAQPGMPILASRTVPIGPYWMTTGAALPITDREAGRAVISQVEEFTRDGISPRARGVSLAITRTCLDAGAAEYILYEDPEEFEEIEKIEEYIDSPPYQVQAVSRRGAGRNDPCPCGSGKKYKRCCLGK
ncbi:MAG TPA: SEC-C metal-binding domain-containing protein [Terriglobia bacterium]|nr:SEC-C metal-binding domain-containing protein [Terriglobia bacterium]